MKWNDKDPFGFEDIGYPWWYVVLIGGGFVALVVYILWLMTG